VLLDAQDLVEQIAGTRQPLLQFWPRSFAFGHDLAVFLDRLEMAEKAASFVPLD